MAEQTEIKKVINVDLGNTTTSLKDYKKHIDELRGSLLQLDETSEEYAKISAEIKTEQDKLNQVMSVGKKNTDAAEGSYDHLVKTMADLKKQWRATADETERADLGKQINGINDKLKTLDASTGNFQRNVGNYEGGFSKAMQGLAGGIKGAAIPAVGGLGKAFTALSANPIGAVIAALVLAIKALSNAMKGNEETSNRMKIALSAFEPIINAVKNAFDWLAKKIVDVFETIGGAIQDTLEAISTALHWLGWDEWAGAIDGYLEKAQQSVNLSEKEVQLSIEKRENAKKQAEIELEISELRAKMADKENYSAQERIEFLNQWEKKEKELADIKLKQATDEYNLIKERNSLTANSAADNQAEADAYIRMVNAQREYNEGLRTITRTKQTLIREINGINASLEKGLDIVNEEITTLQRLELIPVLEPKKAADNIKLSFEAMKGTLKENMQQLNDELKQENFEFSLVKDEMSEQEKLDRQFEIDKAYIEQQITWNNEILANAELNAEQEAELLKANDALKLELSNKARKYAKDTADVETKESERAAAAQRAAMFGTLRAAGNMFGALSDLAEENSKEQKAFAIMETTINGLAAIIGTFKGYSEFGFWGWAQAIAQAATIAAETAATISKIKSTTKSSGGSGGASVTTRGLEMASVNPLLNEQEDINKMTTLNETPQGSPQDLRVYVVESDIEEAGQRTKVREDNSTF